MIFTAFDDKIFLSEIFIIVIIPILKKMGVFLKKVELSDQGYIDKNSMGGSCSRRSAQDRSDLNPAGGYLDTTASGANMNPYFMDPSAQFGGIDRQVGFLIANGLRLAPENFRNLRKFLWICEQIFYNFFCVFARNFDQKLYLAPGLRRLQYMS